jgi:hypothetical protein
MVRIFSIKNKIKYLLMLTVLLVPVVAHADTVRDEFETVSYSNNDGTSNWVADWIEINENTDPAAGNIQIVNDLGSGRLRVQGSFFNQPAIVRETNLLGATSAALSLEYRRNSLENASEYVALEISSDAGANWTELDRFRGPQNDASYQATSYNITSYISANTQIRLIASNGLDFLSDRVYFDNIEINYTLPNISHFAISHDGIADNCSPEDITISKHTAAHLIDTTYTGTINLSTSTNNGDWSLNTGLGTLTNNGNGNATYRYVAADNGQVVLGLFNSFPETLNINITDGTDSEFAAEDPDLTFSNLATTTYRDNFNVIDFNNNDGTGIWTTPWLEINETDGAAAGNIRITNNLGSNRLRVQGDSTSIRQGVEREADLSAATAATLTFDYRRVSLDNASEYVTVEISNDGGASWTELDRFRGPSNDATYQASSYDITAYISANTRVRLLGSNNLDNGFFGFEADQVFFDNLQIAASTITACTLVHHHRITHDGTALTCQPESVLIEACTDATCSSLVGTDVTVTLTPTGWLGGDTQVITLGSELLQLRQSSAAPVTLGILASTPSPANPYECLDTSNASNSCTLTFYDSGFVYNIPTQTSCAASANITVAAVRKDITTQQCIPAFANRNETINFWSTYVSPASGGSQLTLNNGSTDYPLNTAAPGTAVPLNFNSNSEANITLTYADAGQLSLNSNFTGTGAETGLTMTGATTFAAIPAKLYTYTNDLNADCTTADLSCSRFRQAGQNFNLNIRAACANNTVTPNFQHNGITISHTLVAPLGGSPGSIGNPAFDMQPGDIGEHSITDQSVSEVGVFTYTAQLSGAPA